MDGSDGDDILQVETIEAMQRLTLNRPARLNAINQPMAEALLAYFEGLRRNRDIRVVVIRGAGRAFCAGADLKAAGQPDQLQDGARGDWVLRDMTKAMRACPQPLIALVRGPAAGGGMTIALASDVIIASESALFHPAFMGVGLTGAELGISWRLQRAIGLSKAREMLLGNRPLNAAAALEAGLVSAMTAEADLDEQGLALARDMLRAQPDALRLTKRSLDAALEMGSFDGAMEIEERAQMLMVARRGSPD
jgi:enoyl-CoA hydratase/carnithine racemase